MTSPRTEDWTPVSPRSLNIRAYLAEQTVVFKPPVIQHLLDGCRTEQAVEQALALPPLRGGLRHMRHLSLPTCGIHPTDVEIMHINTPDLHALRVVDDPALVRVLHDVGAFSQIKQLTVVSEGTLSPQMVAMILDYEQLRHVELQCQVSREQLLQLLAPDRSLQVKLTRYHTLLWNAVVGRDTPLLRALAAAGADINGCDEHKMTLLTAAIAQDKLEAVPALVAAGADVHMSDGLGFAPICWAALRGNEGALRLLVSAGADIHRLDPQGRTPLDLAIRANALAAVRWLVSAGCDVVSLTVRGSTPLVEAALHGDLDMVRFLVAAGANPSVTCKRGLTPLTYASLAGKQSVVNFLQSCMSRRGNGVGVRA